MITKYLVFEIPRNYGACKAELEARAAEGWKFVSMNEYQIVMSRDEDVVSEPELLTE
jgi:hypothetical protein